MSSDKFNNLGYKNKLWNYQKGFCFRAIGKIFSKQMVKHVRKTSLVLMAQLKGYLTFIGNII